MIIGEVGVDPKDYWKFVSPTRKELDMIITYDFVSLGINYSEEYGKYCLKKIEALDIK